MLSLSSLVASESPSSIQDKCANEVTRVTVCLDYAAGKVPKPSESCCNAAKTMRNSNPVCMCYIIQQVHDQGSPTLKDMGVKVEKLLQLPADCKLANATVSDCPKLLNLPATSPDYSFFTTTNSSKASSDSTPVSQSQASDGSVLECHVAGSVLVAMGVTVLLSMPVMVPYKFEGNLPS